jgi:thymidylate synthase ThyX
VFSDYGDDSVAQLGGAHIACEDVSNVLTKVLEWGRLMSYLEQSTRYVPYTDRRTAAGAITCPPSSTPGAARPIRARDGHAFECYAEWIPRMQEYYAARHPRGATTPRACTAPPSGPRRSTRCAACCRAATQSNVGLFGSGQAFESLLLRMRAHPLLEVRACADEMLVELRKVIPAFLTRLDQPDRGGRWSQYLADARRATDRLARGCSREWPPTSARKSRSAISIRTARRRSSPRRSTHRRRCPTISCWASPGR